MMPRTVREAHCNPTWRVSHQFGPETETECFVCAFQQRTRAAAVRVAATKAERRLGHWCRSDCRRLDATRVWRTVHVTNYIRSFSSRRHTGRFGKALWLRSLISELYGPFSEATTLFFDNQAAIALMKDHHYHASTTTSTCAIIGSVG